MKFKLSFFILFFFAIFCDSQIYYITQNPDFNKKILKNVKEMRVSENGKLIDLQNFDRKGKIIFDKIGFDSLTVIYGYLYDENSRIVRIILCASVYDIMVFDYVYNKEFLYTYEFSNYKSKTSDLKKFEDDFTKINNIQELLHFQVVQDILQTEKVLVGKSKISKEGKVLEAYKLESGVENLDYKIEYLDGKEIRRFVNSKYSYEKKFDKNGRIILDGNNRYFYLGDNLVKTISKNFDDDTLMTDYIFQNDLLIKELDYVNGKLSRFSSYHYDKNKLIEKVFQSGDYQSKETFEFDYW